MRKKHNPSTARELALYVLLRVEEHQSYSNLELKHALNTYPLEKREAALTTELVYGTLSRLNTIDWMINQFVKQGVGKLDGWVRQLLRLSVYQIRYLERIPHRAAVHEAVEIAKKRGHKGISGFVNGVLRQFLRQPEKLRIPHNLPLSRQIALEHSHPEWLIKRWIQTYGEDAAREMARVNNLPPLINIRINRLKTTADSLQKQLAAHFPDGEVVRSALSADGLRVSQVGNIAETDFFKLGMCTIQDESSMLVGRAVAPAPGMEVLDACAAPGGKTTHMAELMDNQGRIVAADIHPHKKKLIEENAERLGIDIIEAITADALQLAGVLEGKQFDRVLLDAPCTGFGVIRRKPDLKWWKKEADIAEIVKVQYGILCEVAKLVKPGGALVYSTCTVEPEENEQLLKRFISENPSFDFDPELTALLPAKLAERYDLTRGYFQILPHHFQSDGFFIARLKKTVD